MFSEEQGKYHQTTEPYHLSTTAMLSSPISPSSGGGHSAKPSDRRILLVTSAFNGLTQRVWEQLRETGYQLSVEFACHMPTLLGAVETFKPDLIVCPFLKERLPADLCTGHRCLIVHPGPPGDKGPSSLDWCISLGHPRWGVTIIEAVEEMDAGKIWGYELFDVPDGTNKAALYRDQVTLVTCRLLEAAVRDAFDAGFRPLPLSHYVEHAPADVIGVARPLMTQKERRIDWRRDDSAAVCRKIKAADSFPGVLNDIQGRKYYMFGCHLETVYKCTAEEDRRHEAVANGLTPSSRIVSTRHKNAVNRECDAVYGRIVATRHGAVCLSACDGEAVWVTHLKPQKCPDTNQLYYKRPATEWIQTFTPDALNGVPDLSGDTFLSSLKSSWNELDYFEIGKVGYIVVSFHNGAWNTSQCERLLKFYQLAVAQPGTRVLAVVSGNDFWGNGIHLNAIEAADDAVLESWHNINAIDDVVLAVINTDAKITVAALNGNAGAGGAMVTQAFDYVLARDGVVLTPFYKTMALFGSEYWTYTLVGRVGQFTADKLTDACLPVGTKRARRLGLIDEVLDANADVYLRQLRARCAALADDAASFDEYLEDKRAKRAADERRRPLADYRHEELARINQCFREPAYARARHNFVYKKSCGQAPDRIAVHNAGRKRKPSGQIYRKQSNIA